MKLIIDIPEDMYKDANILIVKDLPELKKIIANGTIYEEINEGEWIGEHFVYKCSKCGHIADSVITVTGRNIIPMLSNFCPECGADMRGDK